jgi:hypothetical protein
MKRIVLCAVVILSGCAPPAANTTTGNPLANLSAFTVADLQNADKIAVANNDALAHACYPALIAWIQSLPSATQGTTVSGAVSAFELARTTRIGATTGIPNAVKLGCGGLLIDEQTLLLKLGAMAATSVVPVP